MKEVTPFLMFQDGNAEQKKLKLRHRNYF